MTQKNLFIRCALFIRWAGMAGIGLMLAFGYTAYRTASGQERQGQTTTKSSPDNKNPKKDAKNGTKSSSDIAKMAEGDLSGPEAVKKESGPVKEADAPSVLHDIQWLSPHMWAFYAIWFVSLIAVAYAIERFLGLRRRRILPADLASGLRALESRKGDFDLRQAQRLCREYPSSTAYVVKSMLAKVGRPVLEIEKAMTDAMEHEATRLFANVRVQNLAFNVAPMLGLAGTVHGIILCFYTTAHLPLGANKMDSLATGIYAALICTLAGLIVAIPAGILAYYFEGRILKLFQQVEDLARAIVPALERFEGRSRAAILGGDRPPQAAQIIGMPRGDDHDDDPLPAPKPTKRLGQ